MSQVDERVVSLQLETEGFDKDADKVINKINELGDAISSASDTSGDAGDGFKEIEQLLAQMNFDELSSSLEALSERFSTLGIMATAAIANIASRITDLGISFAKSLTVDNISAGFDKYTTKVESVQTIINATRKENESLADAQDRVSTSLGELSRYTDETSYKFTDMLSNIGKFTATGQDLDTSIIAMEGIANWAAKSGVGIDSASNAMYAFSKALGMGSMSNKYWMTIEGLNMNTKEFNETLLQTAIDIGTVQKVTDKASESVKYYSVEEGKMNKNHEIDINNLRDSFSYDWFNTDVMMAVLKKYGDTTTEFGEAAYRAAQEAKTFKDAAGAIQESVASGWATTFETIFGNYLEARNLWTDLTNAITRETGKQRDWRNEAFEEWREADGYNRVLNSIYQIWESLMQMQNTVADVFTEIFGPLDLYGNVLEPITKGIENFANSVNIIDDTVRKFDKDGLTALPDLMWDDDGNAAYFEAFPDAIKNIQLAVTPFINTMKNLWDSLKNVGEIGKDIFTTIRDVGTNAISSFVSAVTGKEVKNLPTLLNAIGGVVENLSAKIKSISENVKSVMSTLLEGFKSNSTPWISALGNVGQIVSNLANTLKNLIKPIIEFISNKFESLGTKAPGIFGKIGNIVNSFTNLIKTISEKILEASKIIGDNVHIKGIFDFINELITGLTGVTTNLGGSALDFISKGIDAIGGIIQKLTGFIGPILSKFGVAVGELSGAKKFNLGKLAFGTILGVVFKQIKEWFLDPEIETLLSPARLVANINSVADNIQKIFGAVKDVLYGMEANQNWDQFKKVGQAMLEFAAALYIIASIDLGALGRSLAVLAGMYVVIMAVAEYIPEIMKQLSALKGGKSGLLDAASDFTEVQAIMLAIVEMAISLLLMAAALAIISLIDPNKLFSSIIAMVILIIAIIYSINTIVEAVKDLKITGVSTAGIAVSLAAIGGIIIALAAAVLILAVTAAAFSLIATISPTGLLDGMFATVVLMAALVGVIYVIMEITKSMTIGGLPNAAATAVIMESMCAMMIAIAAAVLILMPAVAVFSLLSAINPGALANGVNAAIVLMIALIGAVWALSAMASGTTAINLGKMYAMLAAMVIIGLVVTVLAGAVAVLAVINTINASAVDSAAGTLVGIMTALVVVAYVLSKFGAINIAGMAASVGCMLILSVAIVLVVAALAGLAVLYSLDGAAMESALMALVGIMIVMGILMSVLGGIAVANPVGLAAAAGSIAILALALDLLIPVLLTLGILAAGNILGDALGGLMLIMSIIGILAAAGIAGGPAIAGGLVAIAVGITAFGLSLIPVSLAAVGFAAAVALVALSIAALIAVINGPETIAAIGDLFTGMSDGFTKAGESIAAVGEQVTGTANDAVGEVTSQGNAMATALNAVNEQLSSVDTSGVYAAADDQTAAIDYLAQSYSSDALVDMIKKAAGTYVDNKNRSTMNAFDGYYDTSGMSGFYGGTIEDTVSDVVESETKGSTVTIAPEIDTSNIEGKGTEIMDSITSEISADAGDYSAAVSASVGAAMESVGDIASAGGSNASGMALAGFSSTGGEAEYNAIGVARGSAYVEGFNSACGIMSPSREMMKSARFCILGFVRGIEDNQALQYNSVTALAENTISSVNDVFNSDGAVPDITPVVDTNSFQNSINSIDAMYSRSKALSANNSINITGNFDTLNKTTESLNATATRILKSVDGGHNLTLDDGTIAGRINRRLGRRV